MLRRVIFRSPTLLAPVRSLSRAPSKHAARASADLLRRSSASPLFKFRSVSEQQGGRRREDQRERTMHAATHDALRSSAPLRCRFTRPSPLLSSSCRTSLNKRADRKATAIGRRQESIRSQTSTRPASVQPSSGCEAPSLILRFCASFCAVQCHRMQSSNAVEGHVQIRFDSRCDLVCS